MFRYIKIKCHKIFRSIIFTYFNVKTTNGPESFHRTFNTQFYNAHPPIYFVLEALKEMQAEINIKISTIQKIYPKLFHLKICKKLTM
jgi:hypothetical protein